LATDNPFWTFSLALYAARDVAPACLRLQDRHGLDVNLLLYCCWAGCRGVALDAPAMAEILDLSADWMARIVQPLRKVRQTLKGGFGTMPKADCESLRSAVARLELEAERIEQDVLAAALPPATSTGTSVRMAAKANLETYLGVQDIALDNTTLADIGRLIDASWPV
jgi:uncharacterized protein (TIGR02444 family)